MTVRTLCWLNTRSTATTSGANRAIAAVIASAWASSRDPISAAAVGADHLDVHGAQRASGSAVDHTDAAAGHARVDTEHAHAGTHSSRAADCRTVVRASLGGPRVACPGRHAAPRTVVAMRVRPRQTATTPSRAPQPAVPRLRRSHRRRRRPRLGETPARFTPRRPRRLRVRARRLGRLGLPARVRARLRRLPRRRPQRRGGGLPDAQPVQVRAPAAVDRPAAVLHRPGRHRAARRCGVPAPAPVPQQAARRASPRPSARRPTPCSPSCCC